METIKIYLTVDKEEIQKAEQECIQATSGNVGILDALEFDIKAVLEKYGIKSDTKVKVTL